MAGMTTEEWWELRETYGDREAADQLDALAEGQVAFPDVYACLYPKTEPIASGSQFIDGVGVVLSMPWPG